MSRRQRFEALVLPHLDAAFNLARWLLRDVPSAEDAVQEASMRAFRYIDAVKGDDAKPWWLGIVRNTCFSMLARQRGGPELVELDDADIELAQVSAEHHASDPLAQLEQRHLRERLDAAIRGLSPLLREVIVLREFEDLDYAQMASIISVPIGTVMSRLSRARANLRAALTQPNLGQ